MTGLDLELVRTFVAVVDCGGFTRAGTSLHRAQATVSQHVRRLEQSLGRKLLDRDRSGSALALTEDGEVLLGYARRLLATAADAREALSRQPRRPILHFGVTEDFSGRWLTDLLAAFARTYPDVRLDATSAWSVDLLRSIEVGDLDACLVKRPLSSGNCLRSWPERLFWVSAHGADLACDPLPLALFPVGCSYRSGAIAALEEHGRAWRIAFVGQGLASVQAAVASGLGVGLLPEGAVLAEHRRVEAGAGLPPVPETEIALVIRSGRLPAEASALIEKIEQAM